jgi:hypothetical protein
MISPEFRLVVLADGRKLLMGRTTRERKYWMEKGHDLNPELR